MWINVIILNINSKIAGGATRLPLQLQPQNWHKYFKYGRIRHILSENWPFDEKIATFALQEKINMDL